MKKLLIVLAILLVVGAGVSAGDMMGKVTIGGQVRGALIANDTGSGLTSTGVIQGSGSEVRIFASVDDYTKGTITFQATQVGTSVMPFATTPTPAAVSVNSLTLYEIYLQSDIFGALGLDLPVSLNLDFGYYELYYVNWNYVSRSGKEYYYPGAFWSGAPGATGTFIFQTLLNPNLAMTWKVGFGDFMFTYYNSLDFGQMLAAFSGNVAFLNFVVGFSGDYADLGNTGTIYVEAGANLDLGAATLFIPGVFAYNLGGNWNWSSGVKAGIMDMFTVAVGVGGDNVNAFRYILPELSTQAIPGLDIYAIAEIDLADASAFNSVDIGAAYKVGALEINPGVVIALDNTLVTSIANDGYGFQGTGFYVDFTLNF